MPVGNPAKVLIPLHSIWTHRSSPTVNPSCSGGMSKTWFGAELQLCTVARLEPESNLKGRPPMSAGLGPPPPTVGPNIHRPAPARLKTRWPTVRSPSSTMYRRIPGNVSDDVVPEVGSWGARLRVPALRVTRRNYASPASRGCEHVACRRPQSGQYSQISSLPALLGLLGSRRGESELLPARTAGAADRVAHVRDRAQCLREREWRSIAMKTATGKPDQQHANRLPGAERPRTPTRSRRSRRGSSRTRRRASR